MQTARIGKGTGIITVMYTAYSGMKRKADIEEDMGFEYCSSLTFSGFIFTTSYNLFGRLWFNIIIVDTM